MLRRGEKDVEPKKQKMHTSTDAFTGEESHSSKT
jgi:hypothetical protein